MATECIHVWLIESAQEGLAAGHPGTSMGRCQKCSEEKSFLNSVPNSEYNPGNKVGAKSKKGG